ncbi:MAG: single-stranded-DNA-specific exonuclease RecJ [Kiritimatiellae bacterium]|nr:single-stranded-DNA-specific exonuclease RecJ [Kiritimatiellia bacterium]
MRVRAIWRERAFDEALAGELVEKGVSPVIARLLASRGVSPAEMESFFAPSLKQLVSPESLPGISDAVAAIVPFVRARRRIVVFGDYDVDGISACAILVSALRRLGAVAEAFIPKRHGEGYGMTDDSLKRLKSENGDVALIVTVDNGIASSAEISRLKGEGIGVVVTDHHLPPAGAEESPVPDAVALVNPRVRSAPGCDGLCGAGIAFFLASALVSALRDDAVAQGLIADGERLAGPMIVLAGLATIADQMEVRGQNRVLVSAALEMFNRFAPVGLRELLNHAARRAARLTSRDFSFMFAPRLNAAGRVAEARLAYELLMSEDREKARDLVVKIDAHNSERKTMEQRMFSEAMLQAASLEGKGALVVSDARRPEGTEPWNSGVAGIVAARLMEEYCIPVAVVVGDPEKGDITGSARAPGGVNVREALDDAVSALVRHGGHAAAGGFTVKKGMLDEFERLFCDACARRQAASPDAAAIPFDAWLAPSDITSELYDEMHRFEPFGEGNPEPVFGIRGVTFKDVRVMGMEGRHASFEFNDKDLARAVWWGHGADVEEIRSHANARYDILFTLALSDYGSDRPQPELRLVDMRPA